MSEIGISARLAVENMPGELLAPDTVTSSARDASGNLVQLQESRTLSYTGLTAGLSLAAEWYVDKNVYLFGGAKLIVPLSKSVEFKRHVATPANFVYSETGTGEIIEPVQSLETIRTLNLGVFGGIGFSYPITIKTSLFLESLYTRHLTSFITDGDWTIEKISFNGGVRFRF